MKIRENKPIFVTASELKLTDEQLLKTYDDNIERIHSEKQELIRNAPYNRRLSYEQIDEAAEGYDQEVRTVERQRKALFDRMSVKQPKEIWYKSNWFISLLVAIIGVLGIILGALISKGQSYKI